MSVKHEHPQGTDVGSLLSDVIVAPADPPARLDAVSPLGSDTEEEVVNAARQPSHGLSHSNITAEVSTGNDSRCALETLPPQPPAYRRRPCCLGRLPDFAKEDSVVNGLLFRPPPATYTIGETPAGGRLLLVKGGGQCITPHPYLFVSHSQARFLLIHFHGNACD
eukprot:Hpha_TRINITY_DN678_c0_g2::TRINITY_DN678_c0_g2_i1::g.21168::m.21168